VGVQDLLHMTLNSSWYTPERKVWASSHLDFATGLDDFGQSASTRPNKDSRVLQEIEGRSQKIIRSRRVRPMMTSIGFPLLGHLEL
jgi:hypothetical protein